MFLILSLLPFAKCKGRGLHINGINQRKKAPRFSFGPHLPEENRPKKKVPQTSSFDDYLPKEKTGFSFGPDLPEENWHPKSFGPHLPEENTAIPLMPANVKKVNNEKDYSTNNLESIADEVASTFQIDADKVRLFFRLNKWSKSSKQLFNVIQFDRLNMARTVSYAGTVVKITKDFDGFHVQCRRVGISAILAPVVPALIRPHPEMEAFLLNSDQVTNIYNNLVSQIQGDLNAYKNI
ncbi:hypothetical protein TVAG_402390 [Trichomonas vaginalis G3]|uniref:Uncharacterized protein n=1 Tax=Trichomonas vaginalis (strain ATCC PRA-98 / G3) TaxID=412133 RepID=A2DHZ5_TRIV3|nr:hypothetical protein TVAGG3_0271940 [Trichomonas vaginalis G3]EAY19984.1 hypothetical protein TVAG_402390 [Trichomonas vaginalis G3]KAI5525934.1 hypothetical protein TVAGG3_0271940 [Trichomonas vaginalis G3]|eukprot:XP_001580970.1 hypothetical protein [Trichomonas vaginalis G3]